MTKRSESDPLDVSALESEISQAAKVPEPQRVSANAKGMIATQHWRATEAGVWALEQGGNAIDAAVAAAFALAVCEPNASGIGGQTMLMIHLGDEHRSVALDGSSRAPHRTVPGSLKNRERLRGHRATTVPSTPATLDYARKTYGRLDLATVLEPAIRLAEEGYAITPLQNALQRRVVRRMRDRSGAQHFLRNGSRSWPIGSTFRQPALAGTLRILAQRGVEDFYLGEIAQAIHEDVQNNGGLLHADDLAQIPWPVERKPISFRFEGLRLHTLPPPGAGRTFGQLLKWLAHVPERERDLDTPEGALLFAELVRRAWIDRRDRPFDPVYFPQIEENRMLSDDYAERVTRQIRKRVRSSGETTHLSAMDADGNAVGLTQSIERVFGSFEAHPELGFLYNNYMSAYVTEDIGHPYYLRPGAVPWASVAPTIAFRGRKPWLVFGSPGSERIVSSMAQVLLRLTAQSPLDAVQAPRLHCSHEGKVSYEAPRMREDIPAAFARRGFELDARESFSFYLGCVQLVLRDGKQLIGVADPRRDGSAGGPKP